MDTRSYIQMKQEITESIVADRALLDQLRAEIHPLKGQVHPIRERTTTSVSFVATNGGNTNVQFDPFLVQIVRIVDSNDNEYCLEALTPTTKVYKRASSYKNCKIVVLFTSRALPNIAKCFHATGLLWRWKVYSPLRILRISRSHLAG